MDADTLRTPYSGAPRLTRAFCSGLGDMLPDDISTGEIGRRLEAFERHVDRRFTEVNIAIRDANNVHKDVYVTDMGNLQTRVKDLEDRNGRLTGWIVTGAILPIIVVIIVQLLQIQ